MTSDEAVRTVELKVSEMVRIFKKSHDDFFHEKELHAVFFYLCRDVFGRATPREGAGPIHLLRYEYDTFAKYSGTEYRERHVGSVGNATGRMPTTACLDFALLDEGFVKGQDLYTIRNKDETLRGTLREMQKPSPVLAGIEFKMAIARSCTGVRLGGVNGLKKGMLTDCRKLGLERVRVPFVLGFSHGPRPNEEDAVEIADACATMLRENEMQDVRVLVVTPTKITKRGGWGIGF